MEQKNFIGLALLGILTFGVLIWATPKLSGAETPATQVNPAAAPAEGGVVKTGTAADVEAAKAADAERSKKKFSLAVLPFIGKTEDEKALAEKMRFAVAQKMGRDPRFVREDNVEVQNAISALQIPWDTMPSDDDMQRVLDLVDKDVVVMGQMEGRKLTLEFYQNGKLKKQGSAEIPPGRESPRQTVEKLLAEVADMRFVVRDVEADHSDPATERRWATAPNLAPDGDFEAAAKSADNLAPHWWGILGDKQWHPKMLTLEDAEALPQDQVAIVPKAMAGVEESRKSRKEGGDPVTADPESTAQAGSCLLMRMSKNIAENNGLACESDWIPVEDGVKYRFSAKYHSAGPTPRIFIKGFAEAPDQFGDKKDPEATRREYYRAQVLPRKPNHSWDLIEMDFTPSVLEKYKDKKIQWVRVDLYIYLGAGDVWFDDVVVKKIGS